MILASEVWQFLIVVPGFFVVALVWLCVVYLPGRTMERWETQSRERDDGKTASPADPPSSESRPTHDWAGSTYQHHPLS
jgi:hypothetical protein